MREWNTRLRRALHLRGDPRLAPWIGPTLTPLALLVTEVVAHGPFPAPDPLPVTLLVTTLLAVVYAGLRGGLAPAIASAALLGLYTMHLFSPMGAWIVVDAVTLRAGGILFTVGCVMGSAMAGIKRREDGLHAALQTKARDLETRNRDLRRANETLEAFTYVVGHDLKEPVRAIENYLAAAEEEYGTAEGRGFVGKAYAANRRMARLLQGLLAYGRASGAVSEMTEVSVADAIASDEVRAQIDPLLAERRATLEVDPGLPLVHGDAMALRQTFANLLLNAVRHHPGPHPWVRVRAGDTDARGVEILVEDDGAGFPPEVLRGFARLREGQPATVKGGFGLIIAHRALQRMGGDLSLERRPEGGARVRVRLLRPEDAAPRASIAPSSRQAES